MGAHLKRDQQAGVKFPKTQNRRTYATIFVQGRKGSRLDRFFENLQKRFSIGKRLLKSNNETRGENL